MSQQKHHSPQHRLPAGHHDANTAAELLGMSKKALLKRMRELGWLIIGGDAHNLPRREYVQMGYMNTQERGYALKGHQDIARSYRVMLLTQKGYQELKKVIDTNPNSEDQGTAQAAEKRPTRQSGGAPRRAMNPTAADDAQDKPKLIQDMTPEEREAAEAERDQCLEQLRAMGLAS